MRAPLAPLAPLATLLVLALAGCAEDADADLAAGEPTYVTVEATQSTTKVLDASWIAWASACDPSGQPANVFAGALGEVGFEIPENLTAARLEFVWEAVNPTAATLHFYIAGPASEQVEGTSPITVDLALPETRDGEPLEGSFDVTVEPVSCPANAASFEGQTVEVTATFTSMQQQLSA